jgi:glutamate-5-semialdehyde dehydrogenase
MNLEERLIQTKKASLSIQNLTEDKRQQALTALASQLLAQTPRIVAENKKDLSLAHEQQLSSSLIDRLTLTEKSLQAMAEAIREIAAFPQVVNVIESESTRSDNLVIQKERIPIGVIAMIFESRPNVVIDCAALAIKSGNAMVLKGGKEAQFSNRALFEVVQLAAQGFYDPQAICLIETREEVDVLLTMNRWIDLVVPRGGEKLIRHVKSKATMPVVAHDQGLCHMYLHHDAQEAIKLVVNAKVQRPGVCNALETLLVHEDYPLDAFEALVTELLRLKVEIYACPRVLKIFPKLKAADEASWATEWLDLKLNLKIVKDQFEAIAHIQRFGSHHTEAVISQTLQVIEVFKSQIDASCIVINASTRFNDGGQLQLGAELGISTSKLHAYGPMGAREMTTTRFIVKGSGHIRG